MTEATAMVHPPYDTPEAAITFIETQIKDRKRRVDELKDELKELMHQPNADPVRVQAIEQMLQTMASELETEWAQLVAFRDDFDIS